MHWDHGVEEPDWVKKDRLDSRKEVEKWFSTLEGESGEWAETYEIGQTIFTRGELSDRVWFVKSGVIDEWRGDARLAVVNAGDLLGSVTPFGKAPARRLTTAIAVTRVELISMPVMEFVRHLINPGVNRRLIFRKVLAHAGHWVSGATDALEVLTHQRFGRQRSTLVPPDYVMYPADIHMIPCQLPQSLRQELPPFVELDLQPGETPWCVLMVSHYGELRPRFPRHHGAALAFSEASLFIPVKGADGSSCWFQPFGFPNNALSMFKAREVFGMPKMYGNHYIEEIRSMASGAGKIDGSRGDIWRVTGRSGGSTTLDLRIRYAAWEEIDSDMMFNILGGMSGIRRDPGSVETAAGDVGIGCPPEMEKHQEEVLKARVAEHDALPPDERFGFLWWRPGDPEDPDLWSQWMEHSGRVWAAAHIFNQPDPHAWALEKIDDRFASRVRSRSPLKTKAGSTEGDALSTASLVALLKFLPPDKRTSRILSWKRNFTPEVETVDQYMEWDPKDFEVDAVTRTYMTYRRAHGIDLFELSESVVNFRVGTRVLGFRPLLRQKCEVADAAGRIQHSERTFGVRWVSEVLQRAALEPNEPKFELDYLSKPLAGEIKKDPNKAAKMAWGPEVWETADAEPTVGAPRMKPEELPPVSSFGLEPGSQPGFMKVRAAISKAGHELDQKTPTFPNVDRGLDGELRFLVGDDPQLRWLEDGELLFDRHDLRDAAWLIVQGTIEEWSWDTWLSTREASQLVGARYPLAGLVRHTQAVAVGPTAILEIPGERLRALIDQPQMGGFRDYLCWFLGQQAVAQSLEAAYQLDVTSYQYFPGARAVVLPGPYLANDIEMYYLIVQRPTDGWVERNLPPGVEWHPKLPFAMLLIARFANFGPAKIELDTGGGAEYTETGMMIPALVDGKLKIFVPWIFPSNIQAMFAGRELYGYPKTYANTVFDERHKRLLLRRRGETAMSIRYAEREWSEVRVSEVAYLLKCFGEIMAMDWEGIATAHHTEEIDAEALAERDRTPPPPPASQPPKIPIFGFVAPYMEIAARLLPKLPTLLRTLPVACWKRNFASTIQFPSESADSLIIPWKQGDFDVDEVASSGFIVTGLGKVKPFRILEPDGIKLSLGGEVDLAPGDEPYESTFYPLGTLGLHLYYDMEMTVGDTLIDYVIQGIKGEPRLEYGPRARRRPRRKKR